MGDNNTFIFNLKWYEVLLDYPVEVRLEVYEAIMRYASSGTVPDLKPLANMAFSFIRKEMDYNRSRYESTVEKRREAGRRSAEAKAAIRKQAEQVSTNSTSVGDVEQRQQNQHVSTNSTHNDNVNVNDIDNHLDYVDIRGASISSEEFLDQFFSATSVVESFCMSNHVTVDELRTIATSILAEWKLGDVSHNTIKDAKRHLVNQARIKIQKSSQNATDKPQRTQDRLAARRGTDVGSYSPDDYDAAF
ncbi:MAG: hypothetical protein HDS81_06420 [Bacteroidales bacterium]|nr:hypothetical protein [Bacteroidales bacterium]